MVGGRRYSPSSPKIASSSSSPASTRPRSPTCPNGGRRGRAEVVVGELLQPFQLGVDGGGAGEVGVEGGLLGVHRGLRVVIDDTPMNALFDQEAKLFIEHFGNCRCGPPVLQSTLP